MASPSSGERSYDKMSDHLSDRLMLSDCVNGVVDHEQFDLHDLTRVIIDGT